MRNNILVTGASGMVGCYADFGMRPSQKELDVTDARAVAGFFSDTKPKAVLHLAALTDLRYCEEHPEEANRINALGTRALARAAASCGARFVYLSTNAVFDGRKSAPYAEDDVPSPASEYGKSKLAGETYVRRLVPDHLIVRTSWVFGGGERRDKRFVGKIITQLGRPEIKAVSDSRGSPTYAKDLVEELRAALLEERKGVMHITNSAPASRFEQAQFIADFFGYRGRVLPISLREAGSIPPPLENEALVSKTVRLRPWQEALHEYLTTEWASHIHGKDSRAIP